MVTGLSGFCGARWARCKQDSARQAFPKQSEGSTAGAHMFPHGLTTLGCDSWGFSIWSILTPSELNTQPGSWEAFI